MSYRVGTKDKYKTLFSMIPYENKFVPNCEIGVCEITKKHVPEDCLWKCSVSGKKAMRHFLKKSELSGKIALDQYIVKCAISGENLLYNETEKSDLTGKIVNRTLLKKSELSGKFAELEYIEKCEFTNSYVLKNEIIVSQISGKKFRKDQICKSEISGKIGHISEFEKCALTGKSLASSEADCCAITGQYVMPGLLEECQETRQKVLPSELVICRATEKKVLKKLCVLSSISGEYVISNIAIRSHTGKYCLPIEAKQCIWSGKIFHPDDTFECSLTNLTFQKEFLEKNRDGFRVLVDLLSGIRLRAEEQELWEEISRLGSHIFNNSKCNVDSVEMSPEGSALAACLKISTWFGLKTKYIGFIYSVKEKSILGNIVIGKRENGRWISEQDTATQNNAA